MTERSLEHELPAPIATALAEISRSHRHRLLSTPRLISGDWSFRVTVGPARESVGAAPSDWFEFEVLCPSQFPFAVAHARPLRPALRWYPHQYGHGPEHGRYEDIMCPPPLYHVGTAPSLVPYLNHYRAWTEDALAGTLVKNHERYELPHVIPTSSLKYIVYADGGPTALEWTSRHSHGLAILKSISSGECQIAEIVGVQTMFPHGRSDETFATHIGPNCFENDGQSHWVPWAFLGSPVAQRPHRPHLTWRDFAPSQCERIERALEEWFLFDAQKRGSIILLGFAVPETWAGGEPIAVHWQAVDISTLPKHPPKKDGFRRNPPPGRSHVFAWLTQSQPTIMRLFTRDISREALQMRKGTETAGGAPQIEPPQIAKTVVLGLGALGGCIAKTLLRAVPGKSVLVDKEALEPGNLVRHELSAVFLEKNKAASMAVLLKALREEDEVTFVPRDIVSNWSDLLPELSTADLILDATGNHAINVMLARSVELRSAMVAWTYIKPGPEWGVLALRARDTDASLQDAENALKAGVVDEWKRLESQAPEQSGLVWPEPGCHHPTFAAPFYRLRMLADSMVATILAWLRAGASTSLVTLYHQHEATAFLGVETRISGQVPF